MKKHLNAAAFAMALTVATAAAAVPTIYTDEAAFDAAISGATDYTFGFSGTEFTGTEYTLGPVTFDSILLQSYKDAYGMPGVVPYLGNYGPLLTISSTTKALGLHLGSYSGIQTVTYTVGSVIGTLDVPAPDDTTFIGFIDSSPISVTFTNDAELDTIRFTTGDGTVPEPASWAMLIVGFGLTGTAMRRRRTAVVA
jgi:hypothetical protein